MHFDPIERHPLTQRTRAFSFAWLWLAPTTLGTLALEVN
jgi:hypothetical protein